MVAYHFYELYNINNPAALTFQVRHYLASYIETRPWMSIPPSLAGSEFKELIKQLDNKVF